MAEGRERRDGDGEKYNYEVYTRVKSKVREESTQLRESKGILALYPIKEKS